MRFVKRHIQNTKPINVGLGKKEENKPQEQIEEKVTPMNTDEKIMAVSEILNNTEEPKKPVKRIKKEKGLIERTETSKIILNEDNKQLLND